ncbi:MAG: recR [Parachlamydiales bacterium]|nr:recR [Parachlamydiales bacterium]
MPKYPEDLQNLIAALKKLPGIGSKTAERFAFEFINWGSDELTHFGGLLAQIRNKIPPCTTCGCLTQLGQCQFCDSRLRDGHSLCILASARDVYSIEETRAFRGLYHVVEHLLSPLDGRYAAELRVDRIESRIHENQVQEVIIAFDSTLEGDATALFLKERLTSPNVKITRLAFGLPVGSSLDHIDGGTLSRALTGRQTL